MSENDIYKNFGDLLKSRREKLDLSQNELADRLGISKSSYGLYERGGRKIPLSLILDLSVILDFDVDEFFRSQRDATMKEQERFRWEDEFDGIEWTPEECEKIREYARFILAQRKGDK